MFVYGKHVYVSISIYRGRKNKLGETSGRPCYIQRASLFEMTQVVESVRWMSINILYLNPTTFTPKRFEIFEISFELYQSFIAERLYIEVRCFVIVLTCSPLDPGNKRVRMELPGISRILKLSPLLIGCLHMCQLMQIFQIV